MKSHQIFPFDNTINFLFILWFLITGLIPLTAQNAEQQMKLARALENNQEYESALKLYQKQYRDAPNNIVVIGGIKRCLTGLQQYPELINFLNQVLAKALPQNTWRIDLGEAYFLNNERGKALSVWDEQINLQSENPTVYRMIASAMIRQRLYDEAISIYQRAINKLPKQQSLYLEIGNLYRAQLNLEKATESFLNYYLHFPNQAVFLQRQILSLTARGQSVEPVIAAVQSYIDKNPADVFVKEVLAGLYIQAKDYKAALKTYRQLETKETAGKFLHVFANEAVQNKAFDEGISAYKEIILRFPGSQNAGEAIMGIAGAYSEQAFLLRANGLAMDSHKNETQAVRLMQTAVMILDSIKNAKPVSQYRNDCYAILGDINFRFYFDVDAAVQNYRNYIEFGPSGNMREIMRLKLGDALLTRGDLDEARKTYTLIRSSAYRNQATFKLAELVFYSGSFSRALNLYNEIIEQGGASDSLANDALSRVMLISANQSDSTLLAKFAYALQLEFQNKLSQSAEEFSLIAHSGSKMGAAAGRKAGEVFIRMGKYPEANEILQFLITQYPDDNRRDEVLILLASAEEKNSNPQRAIELYRQILLEFPASLFIQIAREKVRELSEILNREKVSG